MCEAPPVSPNYRMSNTLGLRAESAYGGGIQSIRYRPSTPLHIEEQIFFWISICCTSIIFVVYKPNEKPISWLLSWCQCCCLCLSVRVHLGDESCIIAPNGVHRACTVHLPPHWTSPIVRHSSTTAHPFLKHGAPLLRADTAHYNCTMVPCTHTLAPIAERHLWYRPVLSHRRLQPRTSCRMRGDNKDFSIPCLCSSYHGQFRLTQAGPGCSVLIRPESARQEDHWPITSIKC